MATYEETIKAQEKVISKMQSILELQLRKRSVPANVMSLSQSILSKNQPLQNNATLDESVSITKETVLPLASPVELDGSLKKEVLDLRNENERLIYEVS